eukprot:gene7838-biopygen161
MMCTGECLISGGFQTLEGNHIYQNGLHCLETDRGVRPVVKNNILIKVAAFYGGCMEGNNVLHNPSKVAASYEREYHPEPWSHFGALPESTKIAPIELRVEVHHLREAKMVYLNSQLSARLELSWCPLKGMSSGRTVDMVWLWTGPQEIRPSPVNDATKYLSAGIHCRRRFIRRHPTTVVVIFLGF